MVLEMTVLSFCNLQSKRSQFRTSRLVIRVKNTFNPQILRDPDEHRVIFNIDNTPDGHLGNIQRKSENVYIRFADVDKARRNKGIHKSVQLELSNPILI